MYNLLQACEAWKREAEDSCRKTKAAEEERIQAIKQRDEVNIGHWLMKSIL